MKNPTVFKKKNSVKHSNLNDSKKYLLYCCITISCIIALIVYYFITNRTNTYQKIKIELDKDIVYTKYEIESSKHPITVPFVNINSESVQQVNEDIDKYLEWYLANSNLSTVTYRYETSSNKLSLLISTAIIDNVALYDFRSYIIDLDTLNVITDEEVLNQFGLDKSTVFSYFEGIFQGYYNDLVSNGIYTKSRCNYGCFLKSIDVSDYGEGISYYISGNSLIAYRPFKIHGNYHEERYFKDIDFRYILVK